MIATGFLSAWAGCDLSRATAAEGAPVAVAPVVAVLPASFEPLDFSRIEGWREDDHANAFAAFRRSCPAVVKRHAANADPFGAGLAAICKQAMARGDRPIRRAEARFFFERFFMPHRVVHPGKGGQGGHRGLLTGYYEPHIDGSLVRTERFRVPLYRRPPDLENVVSEADRARTGIPLTHMRRTAVGLEPYATRAQIHAGALASQGLELVWLADPVDAFFAQVQGSARIRLPDGTRLGIAYDGKNGHPYTSIGRVLIDRGAMTADAMSMASLGAWLRADEARAREVMEANASYVFFRAMEVPEGQVQAGTRAQGALGTALTPGRSLAVDTAFHLLGSPVFVDAPTLRHWSRRAGERASFRRLMIAQDVGSAIRGPERGDIYFGSGDSAAARAGITKHPGRFLVLLPRDRGPTMSADPR